MVLGNSYERDIQPPKDYDPQVENLCSKGFWFYHQNMSENKQKCVFILHLYRFFKMAPSVDQNTVPLWSTICTVCKLHDYVLAKSKPWRR